MGWLSGLEYNQLRPSFIYRCLIPWHDLESANEIPNIHFVDQVEAGCSKGWLPFTMCQNTFCPSKFFYIIHVSDTHVSGRLWCGQLFSNWILYSQYLAPFINFWKLLNSRKSIWFGFLGSCFIQSISAAATLSEFLLWSPGFITGTETATTSDY